jgi:hypothetical protein
MFDLDSRLHSGNVAGPAFPGADFTILPSALTHADLQLHGYGLAASTAIHEAAHFVARMRNGLQPVELWVGAPPGEDEDDGNRTLGYCLGSGELIPADIADEVLFWGPAAEVLAWAKVRDDNPNSTALTTLYRTAQRGGVSEIPAYDRDQIAAHLDEIERQWSGIIAVADALILSRGHITGDEALAAWKEAAGAD